MSTETTLDQERYIRPVDPDCIPFDQIPHSSRLFLDFLSFSPRVAPFFSPNGASAIMEYAKSLNFDRQRREKVSKVLERQNREWGASEATLAAIARLRAGAVAVVSGQQVGLFGGPLYSILKAASALQLAAELTKNGIDAVPVFWLATEDHDLEEVNQATVALPDGGLETLTVTVTAPAHAPVGEIPFGPEIDELVERVARVLAPDMAAMLRSSYRRAETFGSAFARLFTKLFEGTGLILIQPLDRELHVEAAPVLLAAAERAEEIGQELLRRGKQLRDAGYHEQVKVTASSTLLFVFEDGERTVMHSAGNDYLAGIRKLQRAEVLRRIEQHPEQFSANVLLRPVVQDYLLPTVAYFGGPAEIAYLAQASVVYEKLLGRLTPVLPRLSLTIVNSRMTRLMDKYGLRLPDLFHGEERLRELLASRVLPAELQRRFDEGAGTIHGLIARLREELLRLDITLAAAAEKAGRKMEYQVNRLAGKAARAELRKNEQLAREAKELVENLFPAKSLQERTVFGLFLLSAHGRAVLEKIIAAAGNHCPGHQLLHVE